MTDSTDIRADRRLLLPGPYPPLSHLGATLLRHAVHSALRYALYQLGESPPESPPTRFVALRLYLDGVALRQEASGPDSAEVVAALLDPGGTAAGPLTRRLRGVLLFHRCRLLVRSSAPLRWFTLRARSARGRKRAGRPAASAPAELLSGLLPTLGEALLADLIAALDRRQQRALGRTVSPAQSPEGFRFLAGGRADLGSLGLPDPVAASWNEALPPAAREATNQPLLRSLPSHPLRGRFREEYRRLLDRLRPVLLELGQRSVDKSYLAAPEDLFFVPFELIEDLNGERRPDWLSPAIESNRAEWTEHSERGAPTDTLGNVEPARHLELPGALAPLWPLA